MESVKSFERENRYVVIKLSKCTKAQIERLDATFDNFASACVDCVVVEHHWPEYEIVWGMIEHRMGGKPVPDFDRVSAENLALQQRLTVQDQRVDDLNLELEGFKYRLEVMTADRDAALKPTAEAEPQCLLCLDKKTVPGNIAGGFVKDCPDCCGEEG